MHICAYNVRVSFEWDPQKAGVNLRKHGINFADAATALQDEFALTIRDSSYESEGRWVTLGLDALGRLLVVIYTWRGDNIRLISARAATAHEQQEYGTKR